MRKNPLECLVSVYTNSGNAINIQKPMQAGSMQKLICSSLCVLSLEAVSPYKLQGELKDTRGLRFSDLSEGRRVQVEYGRDQVDVVRHVEGLSPELHS